MPVFYNRPASDSPQDDLTLPGVDITAGVKRFANKKDLYLKSLTKFINDLPEEFTSFEEFSKEEVIAESAAYVHTIKGVVGNLALVDLYDKTVITEQYVKNGTLTASDYSEWTDMIVNTKKTLIPLLPSPSVASNVAQKGKLSDFIKILENFREPLESFNSTKCDELLASVKKFQWESVSDDFISKLSSCIDDFEYEKALMEIEQFIAKSL